MQCPCHSGLPYSECCKPFHKGEALPETALQLMRSRYSAYALHDASYIMATTHPDNLDFTENKATWGISILQFCHQTTFEGLDILEFKDGETEAFVTFFAHLKKNGNDASFQEKSRFLKEKNRWFYRSSS